jgi:NOL1/NOP2/fmu family ribosome biogenesis protein
MAVLRKEDAFGDPGPGTTAKDTRQQRTRQPLDRLGRKEIDPILAWVSDPGFAFIRTGDTIRALPEGLMDDVQLIAATLQVRQSGIALGEPIRHELIPDQALALSTLIDPGVHRLALSREQAMAFVRKDELTLDAAPKGWALATYEGFGLGWVKVLSGRINNYYPKHWRVLKR